MLLRVLLLLSMYRGSNSLKVYMSDESAQRYFFSRYNFNRRSSSSISKYFTKNPLCFLPVPMKTDLCRDIVELLYDTKIQQFELVESAEVSQYACENKIVVFDKVPLLVDVKKKMYVCPVPDMIFENKPENTENLYISNGDKLGTVFVMGPIQDTPYVYVQNYIIGVDIVLGTPQFVKSDDTAEWHYYNYYRRTRKYMAKMVKTNKGNLICSLPEYAKMKLCNAIAAVMYDTGVKNIEIPSTRIPSMNCEKKIIIFGGPYEGKVAKDRMYICPVADMIFDRKPENTPNLYITNGDIYGSVFVMRNYGAPQNVKVQKYINGLSFFI